MLLKYIYDKSLAHASYLVGCQRTGEAIVVDPSRSVDQYLEAAAAEGLRITGSAETHIHADFVSGSRELADRVNARLYLSDEGPVDWKYQFADKQDSQMLKDRDTFYVGKLTVLAARAAKVSARFQQRPLAMKSCSILRYNTMTSKSSSTTSWRISPRLRSTLP